MAARARALDPGRSELERSLILLRRTFTSCCVTVTSAFLTSHFSSSRAALLENADCLQLCVDLVHLRGAKILGRLRPRDHDTV